MALTRPSAVRAFGSTAFAFSTGYVKVLSLICQREIEMSPFVAK